MNENASSGNGRDPGVSAAAVVTKDLRRIYEDREAVRGVSLEIHHGEIFGLLGPNGAGKTTTLSMISTRIRPTTGDAWVYGKHVVREVHAARRLLNVAPQEEALYPSLTAAENLAFFARLYGVPKGQRRERMDAALDAVALTSRQDDLVSTFSGGMRRRLNLGCALVTSPRIVLLDEPTVGVDPQSRAHIFDAVRSLREQGVTILYTTHHLEEAEELCDRIAIMDEGRIVALGTLAELLSRSGASEMIQLRFAHPPASLDGIDSLPAVQRVEVVGPELRIFTADAQSTLPGLLSHTKQAREALVQMRIQPVTLETVFIELTGKELRD